MGIRDSVTTIHVQCGSQLGMRRPHERLQKQRNTVPRPSFVQRHWSRHVNMQPRALTMYMNVGANGCHLRA